MSWVSVCVGRFWCSDMAGLRRFGLFAKVLLDFDIFIDVGRSYTISKICWIGIRMDLVILYLNLVWIIFNWSCWSFYEFELLGWIWADFRRFDRIV